MRCTTNLLVAMMALVPLCWIAALAQTPTYKVGRTASPEEVRAFDSIVGPEGKELPPGRGTVQEGAKVWAQWCAKCHGTDGKYQWPGRVHPPSAGMTPLLAGEKGLVMQKQFATTIWDYTNRAMPQYEEGTLRPDEVYALTAFLLYQNGIIQEGEVMDAQSLPKIQMPNRNGFVPAWPEWKAPSGDRSRTP